ncbi:MAG TPA: CDP-alcohol phosphatidyltransferase family protein [Actinomycetota bacterium]|nr:CDP-alcohol phosphatidyltransferase family protein [Actinomycetota bacterium]
MPNILSAIRILLIPAFVILLVRPGTRLAGFLLLGLVVSTDWVDGALARRTGQVTELGKLLDPLADRLAMAAAIIALVAVGLLPLWAAAVILVRDLVVLAAAVWLAATRGPRIDVRPIGKYATFTLMWAIPAIAWGNAGLPLDDVFVVFGWTWFAVGAIEYYVAAVAYAFDLRRAFAERRAAPSPKGPEGRRL